MRPRVFAILVVLGCTLAALAEPPAPRGSADPVTALPATTPSANGTSAADSLLLVVALFRHGIRAPLKDFSYTARVRSKDDWPELSEWGAAHWGDLTAHGKDLAVALGQYYAEDYKKRFNRSFSGFIWADIDARTQDTASALATGFSNGQVTVTVKHRDSGPDPLFHPFKSGCGTPADNELWAIADDIDKNWPYWLANNHVGFEDNVSVLKCLRSCDCDSPLYQVSDSASPSCLCGERGTSPLKWQGRFPYMASASEAFVLEYVNNMPPAKVGWGRVAPPNSGSPNLFEMLKLHEFYFEKTEREPYLAKVHGSNLLREIGWTLTNDLPSCRRIPVGYQFAAFLGHDTNIANVAALLNIQWTFNQTLVPDGTKDVPLNDALPSGALVFELWNTDSGRVVRIFYVAQGLLQMRNGSGGAFRIAVAGKNCQRGPALCEIKLDVFQRLVNDAIGPDNPFLSRCEGKDQVCSNACEERQP